MIRSRLTRLVTLATALVMAIYAAPTLAARPDTPADRIASLLEAALDARGGPHGTIVVPTPRPSNDFVTSSSRGSVRIPADTSDQVELIGSDETIGIGLPTDSQTQHAAITKNGTAVYEDVFESASIAVQVPKHDQIRIAVVLEGLKAPTEYRFPLEVPSDSEILIQDNGSVSITNEDGMGFEIETPWAVDANGDAVPTSYRLEGTTLVQTVKHTGAAYPVVADPSITFGKNIYVWLWGWELKTLTQMGPTGLSVWFCAHFGAAHPVMCAIGAIGALYIINALENEFTTLQYYQCRYVIAFRYWGIPNYTERLSNPPACPYKKFEMPG